ncbi:MAG TPA: (5-formylfuran-3-yl)methyl phosphate synthase [Methylophilaceae bacterium]|nr:(5-formylfuran-3-yl)methyl phosphate synthase [Methylophilaceae bacterium]
MTRLLASVTSAEEAMIALEAGADIIDLKNPAQGTLGALPLDVIRAIVKVVDGRRPVSATIGDLPVQPSLLAGRVAETASTGVDIIKVGFFGNTGHQEAVRALTPLVAMGACIVAVLFADHRPDMKLLPLLENAGFYGVMLDTENKNGGRLTDYLGLDALHDFVIASRSKRMQVGLAGSLMESDIASLSLLKPDYLGFRGALCANHERKAMLDRTHLESVQSMLRECNKLAVDAH